MASLMTTGSVHRLIDDDQTTRDFILWAARGTMACVTIRDDGPGPAPRTIAPSEYHESLPDKLQAEIDRLHAMSEEERVGHGAKAIADDRARIEGAIHTHAAEADKLARTLAELREWTAPPDWEEFRARIMGEVQEALSSARDGTYFHDELVRLHEQTPEGRWASDVEQVSIRLGRAIEDRRAERSRAADRTRFLAALYDSLPGERS